MLPVTPSSPKAAIATMQRRLNDAYDTGLTPDGIWGPNTQAAVELIPGAVSGDQSVGGNEWHNLTKAFIVATVPAGPAGPQGEPGPEGPEGPPGPQPTSATFGYG